MSDLAIEKSRHWLNKIVIGLNLCPFASKVVDEDTLRIHAVNAPSQALQMTAILQELETLQCSDEAEISTSLLIFTEGADDFNDYLDLLAMAEDLIEEVGLSGVIQVASFHPDYCFAGVPEDDVSNYSNRSPYPMLHFIREVQMSQALAHYPNPEEIPDNNIQRLRELGLAGVKAQLDS